MKQTLTLPEWHALTQEGVSLPMRIRVVGTSMFPLIRGHRDWVTILPLREPPRRGDVVLAVDPFNAERYVLHRVWRTEAEAVLTWGDNCDAPDGLIPLSHLWGRVVLVERGERRIEPDPVRGLRHARCWHVLGKGWRLLRRWKHALARKPRGGTEPPAGAGAP